ncbi:MAG: TIGR00270 family protein [Nanoarchaeota archaeon]|nr:TIGR00270 family protein [Nanoarchaeota archaeon]
MRCDLCGKEGNLVRTIVEGTELNVCRGCSSFGRVVERGSRPIHVSNEPISNNGRSRRYTSVTRDIAPKIVEFIKDDIGQLIKRKREKLGLKQEEFAKKIAVKESMVHNIESGHFKPNIEMARKIGRFLKIKLIEDAVEGKIEKITTIGASGMTLGDMITITQRKKK